MPVFLYGTIRQAYQEPKVHGRSGSAGALCDLARGEPRVSDSYFDAKLHCHEPIVNVEKFVTARITGVRGQTAANIFQIGKYWKGSGRAQELHFETRTLPIQSELPKLDLSDKLESCSSRKVRALRLNLQ